MKRNSARVYSKESTMPNIGKGLFAKIDIKKGSIICEYIGRLKNMSEVVNRRSTVFFNDNMALECPPNDLASFANDCIKFPDQHRKLMECLKSNEPFYKKHDKSVINANIKINDEHHRAFLEAECNIKAGDEIFCHYGFLYWFGKETNEFGFMIEDEIVKNGFPEKIFEYDGFKSYVKEFYNSENITLIKYSDKVTDVIINTQDNQFVLLPFKNRLFCDGQFTEKNRQ